MASVTQADRDVFQRRLGSEGIIFLTQHLPKLGKAVEKAIIVNEPFVIDGRFGKHKNSVLPSFLYQIFKQIFTDEGILLSNASPHHIKWIRQLTLMYYKLEVGYEEDVLNNSIELYKSNDTSLGHPISAMGDQVCGEILCDLLENRKTNGYTCNPLDIIPRHGSGATACRTKPWNKYHSFRYIEKLNSQFPYTDYFFFNYSHLSDELQKLSESETLDLPVSRMAAVPKDSRGPRLICMEPREMQYVQQGLMRKLYQYIEEHPLTSGHVNFTNQNINRDLAKLSSINGAYATLDLKDASDMVRWDIVKRIFPKRWVDALDACRTEYVELPNGEVYGPLKKFASMGSAVCFPVESLYFWAILVGNLRTYDVYVYGDDLIVPIALVNKAIAALESYGLKVNVEKSCYKTNFRESCGGDYFNGFDVGYVKVRKLVQESLESHTSTVEFVNEIISHYGTEVARALMSYVDGYYYPHIRTLESVALSYRCNYSASNDVFFKRRWNKHLQKYELRIPIITQVTFSPKKNPKFHWCELLRAFLTGSVKDRSITDHNLKQGYICDVGTYAEGRSIVKQAWRGDL